AEIFAHLTSQFTQYRYLADHQHLTISNEPAIVKDGEIEYNVAKPGSNCVMLWMDPLRESLFKEKGFAYCHAISDNDKRSLEIEISVEKGAELVPYGGGRGQRPKTKN